MPKSLELKDVLPAIQEITEYFVDRSGSVQGISSLALILQAEVGYWFL